MARKRENDGISGDHVFEEPPRPWMQSTADPWPSISTAISLMMCVLIFLPYSNLFSLKPRPSLSMRTLSADFRYSGGFRPMTTTATLLLRVTTPGTRWARDGLREGKEGV